MNREYLSLLLFFGFFPLAICILLLGFRAFKHKEVMAIIKAGKDLGIQTRSVNRHVLLIWAAVLLGNALGLLFGGGVTLMAKVDLPFAVILTIALMLLFTGFSLLICFLYIKRTAV